MKTAFPYKNALWSFSMSVTTHPTSELYFQEVFVVKLYNYSERSIKYSWIRDVERVFISCAKEDFLLYPKKETAGQVNLLLCLSLALSNQSVHRNNTVIYIQQDATSHGLFFWEVLYMFRVWVCCVRQTNSLTAILCDVTNFMGHSTWKEY
jgi:hypothetical protein